MLYTEGLECLQHTGVSIKIEVASGLNRVTDCINKGPLVPFSILSALRPRKFLNFKALKMRFSAFWGLNLRTKERVFIQKNVAFNLPVTQSIPTSNEQMMKTKLRTFARKQVLRKPVRKFCKNDWNIAFTWLKHNVKPVGLSEKKLSCFFFL